MLEWQHVPIEIAGLNTKSDDKNAVPGTLVTCENMYMLKTKKLQNRYGYKFVTTPVTHTSEVIASEPMGNSVISMQRNGIYYENETTTAINYSSSITYQTLEFSTFKNIYALDTQGTTYKYVAHGVDSTANKGAIVYYTTTNTTITAITYDLLDSNIATTLSTTTITLVTQPCVTSYNTVVFATSAAIFIYNINTLTQVSTQAYGGVATPTQMRCYETTNYIAGIMYRDQPEYTFFVYNKNTGVWSVTVKSTLSAIYSANLIISEADSKIYVVYGLFISTYLDNFNLAGVYGARVTLGITSANSAVQIELANRDSTYLHVLAEYVSSVSYSAVSLFTVNKSTGAGISGSSVPVYQGYQIESVINSPYFILGPSHTTGPTSFYLNHCYFLCAINNDQITVLSSYSYAQAMNAFSLFGANRNMMFFRGVSIPYIRYSALSQGSYSTYYNLIFGYSLLNYTTNEPEIINWNGSMLTSAWGNLRSLDSVKRSPPLWSSFPIAPEPLNIASSGSAGFLSAGVYSYVVQYEYTDHQGNKRYTAPIFSREFDNSAGLYTTLSLTLPECPLIDGYAIIKYIYRTEANGSIYYFLATTSIASFSDTVPDSFLINNQAIYTAGGIVESAPCPLIKYMVVAKNRLWIVSSESDDVIYFSKKIYPGELPQFNEIYQLRVQNLGGELESLAEMDDKIIIFRKNAVYVTYGDGPDELGNGSFADPQIVTVSLGCKYPRSVVLNDKGIFFMSYEGIYLITRGLTVEYIGAPVEQYNYLQITQAINLVDRHQLWFFSAEGTTLVHDDYFGIWYTFTNQATYAANMLNDGTPYYYRALATSKYPGRLMLEDDTLYYDGAVDNPITINLEFSWINLAQVQGFQRIRTLTILGKLSDTQTLSLYSDYNSSTAETFSIVPATVGTNPTQYQVKPTNQRSQTMKFKLTLAAITGPIEVTSVAFEAGLKRGTYRFDRSKRVSS